MTPPARPSLVACQDLFQIYRLGGHEVVALQGVDLDVARGELLALLGPSGAGKSTLLSLLGGLERPSAGRVWVDGQDLARLPEAALTAFRRRQVGFVVQTPARNLLPYASATQNLELPMRLAGVPPARRRERTRALLAATGLQDLGGRPVRALSGGEQQRLAVAVAVANEPPLLLADEPTSQLDRANVARVLELLRALRDQTGTTVVMVTHDPEAAGAMDRTVSIRGGRVGAEGRGGVEYAVVGPTGLVQLPADALEVLPPGARALVEVGDGPVLLHPVEPPGETPEEGRC
ncbi:MAG TPA: ABC transporter ATP-binding protein [Actinomycetes bacterium]|nr:ABC transporter ATP-binding protein [Actinomycetes bacterium]